DTDNCLSLNDGLSSAVICAPGNIFSYQTQIEGVEDFHLLPDVQSVDAGLDSILVALNSQYDLDRRERIIGLSTDIGCFEQNVQLPSIPYFKFSPSSQTACAGDSLSFKVLVGNNNQYSIQWKHNGIILQESLDTAILLQNIGSNSQGIYQVTIFGEGDTIKGAPFSLNIQPEPIFFGKIFLPDTAFCPVDSIIIYTGSSDNNNVRGEFSIEINDDTILQLDQDTIILQFLPGKYDVTLKVDYTSECGRFFSIEKEVVHFTVAPDSIPPLTISGPDTSFCEGTLVSFLPGNQEIIDSSQLLWFINGELIQENRLLLETNRLKDGDQIFYKWICIDCICVPQSQNFFSDTITVQVEDCISQVDEKNEKSQVYKVYPNPGSGTIKINTSFEVSNIKLFNLSGNKVFEKGILDQKGVISVSIRDIQEGLYLLFIQSDKDVFQEWIYISN
ncbi:MAG: T9SS type A sorting domain-containing protein, partial [Saprospiraceae bacterium]|nr:T9SS type A sorting domain-containing protein [Saprospiraceae bacterium]